MKPPQAEEYSQFYQKYIDTVSENVLAELEHQAISFATFLKGISSDKATFAYADGKWTIKELVGHIIDTERIMAYRLLTISRNDKTALPGFDENEYVKNAHFSERTLESLADEFASVRRSNMYLIKSINEEQVNMKGLANGSPVSVRALIYILAGHLNHHRKIIEERYL